MILSHLHFDHCGGAVSKNGDKLNTTFQNARYWTHSRHFEWAKAPNAREKATFLTENIMPIQENGQLNFIDLQKNNPFKNIELLEADGHTEKMLMPLISYNDKKILFIADTIPSTAHVHIPYVMSYDVRPLQTMIEKQRILTRAIDENWVIYYDHDPKFACSNIEITEKGFRALNFGQLNDFI